MSAFDTDRELDLDPRWRRFMSQDWSCSSCGGTHSGIIDLALGKPEQWPGEEIIAPNSALDLSGNFLSEDFCVLEGQHFFVRGILLLPIIGSGGEQFGFGAWSTLSKTNFEIYADTFDRGQHDGLGPYFGWFSNRLKGYPDTLNLKCQVHPVGGRQRPHVAIEPIDHILAEEQRSGISFDRLLDIYAINGHDIRPSLTD